MARPRKKIDPILVARLAALQCTYEEIAAVAECSPDTIKRRFASVVAKGREKGKTSLRRAQFKLAAKSATMGIWLGKQWLGQREPESSTANQPSTDALELARAVRDAVRAMRDADGLAS